MFPNEKRSPVSCFNKDSSILKTLDVSYMSPSTPSAPAIPGSFPAVARRAGITSPSSGYGYTTPPATAAGTTIDTLNAQAMVPLTELQTIPAKAHKIATVTDSDLINYTTDTTSFSKLWSEIKSSLVVENSTNGYVHNNYYFVPVSRYEVTQVSNTNPTGTDGIAKLVIHNGEIYFGANKTSTISKLFKLSNSGVISQVANTNLTPSESSDRAHAFFSYNNKLYFFGSTYYSTQGVSATGKLMELSSDGATATQLTQLRPAAGGSSTSDDGILLGSPFMLNGEMHYVMGNVNDWTSRKLHKVSTANPGVISQVSNTTGNPTGSTGPDFFTTVNEKTFVANGSDVYFAAGNANVKENAGLFKMTAAGVISELSNLSPGRSSNSENIRNVTLLNNEIYFTGKKWISGPGSGNEKIFKVTPAGVITQISNIAGSTADDFVTSMKEFNGKIYFTLSSSNGKMYSLTSAGAITQVSNIRAGVENGLILEKDANYLYFTANNAAGFNKLHRMDTSGTITQVSDIKGPTVSDSISSDNLIFYKNEFYFVASQSSGHLKLYKVGSSGDSTQVSNTAGAVAHDSPTIFIIHNDELYFTANNASAQQKLYKIKKID